MTSAGVNVCIPLVVFILTDLQHRPRPLLIANTAKIQRYLTFILWSIKSIAAITWMIHIYSMMWPVCLIKIIYLPDGLFIETREGVGTISPATSTSGSVIMMLTQMVSVVQTINYKLARKRHIQGPQNSSQKVSGKGGPDGNGWVWDLKEIEHCSLPFSRGLESSAPNYCLR